MWSFFQINWQSHGLTAGFSEPAGFRSDAFLGRVRRFLSEAKKPAMRQAPAPPAFDRAARRTARLASDQLDFAPIERKGGRGHTWDEHSVIGAQAQTAGHREAAVTLPFRTNEEHQVPGNPREMITMAERRFPVRIRIGFPPNGLGRRHTQMTGWLDENCGSDGWAMTPSAMRGVLNDAISIYFADATLASAFVARWCAVSKVETAGGVFRVRDDEPAPRIGAGLHRTP